MLHLILPMTQKAAGMASSINTVEPPHHMQCLRISCYCMQARTALLGKISRDRLMLAGVRLLALRWFTSNAASSQILQRVHESISFLLVVMGYSYTFSSGVHILTSGARHLGLPALSFPTSSGVQTKRPHEKLRNT